MTFGGTAVATASKLTLDDIISTKPHGERERLNFRQAAQAAMRKRKLSPMVPRLLCGTMQSKRLKISPVVLKSRSCHATGRVWPVSGTGGAAKIALVEVSRAFDPHDAFVHAPAANPDIGGLRHTSVGGSVWLAFPEMPIAKIPSGAGREVLASFMLLQSTRCPLPL